jgi:hypothetical protein
MQIQFGNSYKFYQMSAARQKAQELNKKGIESAIETNTGGSSHGGAGATVMSYIVHTDENGTKDLTNFRRRRGLGSEE